MVVVEEDVGEVDVDVDVEVDVLVILGDLVDVVGHDQVRQLFAIFLVKMTKTEKWHFSRFWS